MEKSASHKKKTKTILVLDPDKLGLVAAAFFATIVMAVGFWRRVDGLETTFRVVVAAGVSYCATFLFVRYILRAVLKEVAESRRMEREAEVEERRRRQEEAKAKAEEEEAGGE